MVKRYILTGAPGSGKTTLLDALRERGHAVVDEAATEVMASQSALGIESPWARPEFLDLIVTRQHAQRVTADALDASVQFYDRSPLCTLALARFLDHPVTATLAAEVDAVLRERLFEPAVFFVRLLGFIEPTLRAANQLRGIRSLRASARGGVSRTRLRSRQRSCRLGD